MPLLLSISTGRAENLLVREESAQDRFERVVSGIAKTSVSHVGESSPREVSIHALGIDGDEQADLTVHGGLEKAVYVYPVEHYALWKREVPWLATLAPEHLYGMVGENLTVSGLTEEEVYVGDRLTLGDVVLEVTKAREPCYKFNAKMKSKYAAKFMVSRDICGWYCRVVTAGPLKPGLSIGVTAGQRELSIARQSRFLAK